MLVPDPRLFKVGAVPRLVRVGEDLEELAVVLLQDRVLGGEVERPAWSGVAGWRVGGGWEIGREIDAQRLMRRGRLNL